MASKTHDLFDGRASLLLAEDLEVEYSAALMRRFGSKRSARGRLISAWNHMEYGLNTSINAPPEIRHHYLASAQDLLTMIHHKSEVPSDTHLEAMVLSTYLPLFRKRAVNSEVTRDDCMSVYMSLGHALSYLRPFEETSVPPTTTLEAVTLALSARIRQPDMLLFPTSPREEASQAQSVNHDSYFLSSGVKLPIQQKLVPTDKSYAESITMLTFMPLVNKAYKKYWPNEEVPMTEKLNAIIGAIMAETHTEQLNSCEIGCLNYLSSGIAGHYREALARIDSSVAA